LPSGPDPLPYPEGDTVSQVNLAPLLERSIEQVQIEKIRRLESENADLRRRCEAAERARRKLADAVAFVRMALKDGLKALELGGQ
jgi:hypothetical protein